MACHLLSAKPLPEPMLSYFQLDSWEQISVKFESKFCHFHSRKMHLKMPSSEMAAILSRARWDKWGLVMHGCIDGGSSFVTINFFSTYSVPSLYINQCLWQGYSWDGLASYVSKLIDEMSGFEFCRCGLAWWTVQIWAQTVPNLVILSWPCDAISWHQRSSLSGF